ncbi:MAG TPA: GNAT family N-acetyltransferase [Mucilaginibacter sp.]|jgi:ribosomal-protein-alanine N-acetyltransferase|nr:GNAT family N-acetyltransferase [Mucilaginibacter sp.]
MKFTNLITERLFLRELQPDDAEEIFRLRSDDRVNQFVDRARAVTIDNAHNFIRMIQSNSANNEGMFWALTLIGEAKLIGTIVYWHIEWENCRAEIGYEMLPEYQGKGLMTEALKKVIEFGFEELKFKTIMGEPKERNERSIRVLEKLGFKLTGKDGEYLIYSLSSAS